MLRRIDLSHIAAHALVVALVLGGVGLLGTLVGCGSSGSPPAPTVTSVAPVQGSTLGGTSVTITGTNFLTANAVTFGGNPATAVLVASATTITCTTPAGTGLVDVAVSGPGGTGTLPAAYTYNPPPTVTALSLPTTSNFGGTAITLGGSGFVANAAGTNTVTIGGTPATSVITVNDTTITCVTPAGPAGANPIVVSNANGPAAPLAFSLFEPILVADGGGSPVPASWDLWAFDPITGFAHIVGPIGFGVTAMDFDPVSGTLYGGTAPGANGPPRELVSINPVTGAGTLIGSTDDIGAVNHLLQGCTYVGNVLHGVDGPGSNLLTVNTTTALVTILFSGAPLAPGGGLAADATSTNVYYMDADTSTLDSVDVGTGVFTPGPTLNGVSATGGRINAAAFHLGTLYGLQAASPGGGGSPRQIVTINTTTGLLTPVGAVLSSGLAAAIASRTR